MRRPPLLKIAALVLSFFFACGALFARQTSWIVGRIFDRETKDPLPAYVLLEDGRGVSAGADGRFKISVSQPPGGKVRISVWLIGYKKKDVEAAVGSAVEIGLDLEPLPAREVTVTADSAVSDEKAKKTVTLSQMEIYTLPGTAADPLYASHVLPGVNSPPDASSLLIRGGAPDEVAYLFDGIEVRHPFLSESLHESYFSIFDNQVVERFNVATSGFHPKYGDALSGVMDITAKDLVTKSEGGLGLSVLGLNSYAGFPIKGVGSFVGSYNRGYSDVLTRLNSRGGDHEFRTEQGFGKFHIGIGRSNQIRITGLYDRYRYAEESSFEASSKNSLGALSWTTAPARNFAATLTVSATRFDVTFDQPASIAVKSRDDVVQARLESAWDLDRHFIEFGADIQARRIETSVRGSSENEYRTRATRSGVYANDKFRATDRLYVNLGFRAQALSLSDRGWSFDPRASAALLVTQKDILRLSAGWYHQFGDFFVIARNPELRPKSAAHIALSYDRITDDLDFRATLYDKEYRRLFLSGGDGWVDNGGRGYARGAEVFVKRKAKKYEILCVYNFLDAKRLENEVRVLAPSPWEIAHSATAIFTWKLKRGSLGIRYSLASGRPFTPLLGREWDADNQDYLPVWGAPYSETYPAYQRLDLNGSLQFDAFRRLIVVYFGITNVLDNGNISRYDYGPDYGGRKDQQSIFGRSLFLGLYVPFF